VHNALFIAFQTSTQRWTDGYLSIPPWLHVYEFPIIGIPHMQYNSSKQMFSDIGVSVSFHYAYHQTFECMN